MSKQTRGISIWAEYLIASIPLWPAEGFWHIYSNSSECNACANLTISRKTTLKLDSVVLTETNGVKTGQFWFPPKYVKSMR